MIKPHYYRFSIFSIFILTFLLILNSCQTEQKINGGNPVGPSGSELTIISPNGGELLIAGTQFEITWTSNGIGTVKIEYTSDNGSNWTILAADYPNTGSYNWVSVPEIVSNEYLIKITTSDNLASDQSDRAFGIVASTSKSLNITKPNGGEELFVGQSYSIEWFSTGIQNIKIEYSSNNGATWTMIAGSYPADSASYLWSPVPNFPSSQGLDTAADTVTSVSGTAFTITASRILTIISPNGGETWAN